MDGDIFKRIKVEDEVNCDEKSNNKRMRRLPYRGIYTATSPVPYEVPPEPYQPDEVSPYRDRRRPHFFQKKWYDVYPWLHYDTTSEGMYCHQCLTGLSNGVAYTNPSIFVRGGFRNWKKGLERFKAHENNQFHKETIEFSVQKRRFLLEKYRGLECIVTSVKYLADEAMLLEEGSLSRLLEIRRKELPFVDVILRRLPFTQEDEKEIISLMAACILRTMCGRVKESGDFALFIDKVDTSVGEMFALNVHSVRNTNDELFLGLYLENSIVSDLPLILSFEHLKYHSYGFVKDNKLKDAIQKLQPHAMNVPSGKSNLSLSLQEALISLPIIGSCISLINEMKSVLQSSDLSTIFEDDSEDSNTSYCTRKSMSFKIITGILNNYTKILNILEEMHRSSPYSFVISAIHRELSRAETFFNFLVGKILIYPIENLSNAIQNSKCVKDIQAAVGSVIQILQTFKEDKEFEILWDKLKQKSPIGLSESDAENVEKKKLSQDYYSKIIDATVKEIVDIFEGLGFQKLVQLERALLTWELESADELIHEVLESYNISMDALNVEKAMLAKTLNWDPSSAVNVYELIGKVKSLKIQSSILFPQLVKLIDLISLAPLGQDFGDSLAKSRTLYTFLAKYKSKQLISDACICYMYKDEPDVINAAEVAQEYVNSDPVRASIIFSV